MGIDSGKLNVGTLRHPVLLTAQSAAALMCMQERVNYAIRRSGHINALLNRGLLKENVSWLEGRVLYCKVLVTRRGVAAQQRTRKRLF